MRHRTGRAGLLGSGVVGKEVADFLDLHYVMRSAAADWFRPASQAPQCRTILMVDASGFSRGLIRSGLDMAGYTVLEAAGRDEAIATLERHSESIWSSTQRLLLAGGGMRRRPEWRRIPVLPLTDAGDREAMLESIMRLASALAPPAENPAGAAEKEMQLA